MNDMYLKSKRIYLGLTGRTKQFELKMEAEFRQDRDEKRRAQETLARNNLHKEQIRKMRLRSQGPMGEEEERGLDFSRRPSIANKNNETGHDEDEEEI